jgi:DNA modification methylase
MFTSEGNIVLDSFCGFGSVPFVCNYFNRNYIGIEIDEKKADLTRRMITAGKIFSLKDFETKEENYKQKKITKFLT